MAEEVTIKINAELTELIAALNKVAGVTDKVKVAFNDLEQEAKSGFEGEVPKAVNNTTKALKDLDAELRAVKVSMSKTSDPAAIANLKKYEQELLKEEQALNKVKGGTTSLIAEKRALIREMALLDRAGEKNSKKYNELAAKAGILTDALRDANQRAKNFGSDTRNTEAFAQGVGGLVAAFSVYQGVVALVGEENKDLQKTMTKLFAAMAAANGIQQIANILQAESSVMVALNNIQLSLQEAATVGATTAQKGLNVAMKAAPYALAIAAVAALVVYLMNFNDVSESLVESQKEYNKRVEDGKNIIEQYKGSLSKINTESEKELILSKSLFDVAKDNTKSRKEHKTAIDKINSVYGELLGYQLSEKTNINDLSKAYGIIASQLVVMRTIKLETSKLDELLAQKELKLLSLAEAQKITNKDIQKEAADTGQSYKLLLEINKANISGIEKSITTLNTEISQRALLIENLTSGINVKQKDDKTTKEQVKATRDINEVLIEENKQLRERNKLTSQNYVFDANAIKEQYQIRLRLAKEGTQERIDAELALEQIRYFEAQSLAVGNTVTLDLIEKEHQANITQITKDGLKRRDELEEEAYQKKLTRIQKEAQTWGGVLKDAIGVVSMFQQTRTENDLIDLNNKFETEEALYKKQLETQVLNQEQFDAKMKVLNEKKAAEEKKIKHDAWEKDKRAKIIQTEIDGALAAISQLTGGPEGWVLAILAELAAQAAVIAIAGQKNPYRKGTAQILGGRSHEQGGVSLGSFGEAEKGEFIGITSKQATTKYGKGLLSLFEGLNQSNTDKINFGLNDIAVNSGFDASNTNFTVSLNEVPEIRRIEKLMQKNTSITYHNGYRVEKNGSYTRIIYG